MKTKKKKNKVRKANLDKPLKRTSKKLRKTTGFVMDVIGSKMMISTARGLS